MVNDYVKVSTSANEKQVAISAVMLVIHLGHRSIYKKTYSNLGMRLMKAIHIRHVKEILMGMNT